MPLRLDVKKKLQTSSERVKSIDFHPSEPWILSGLYNGTITMRDIRQQEAVDHHLRGRPAGQGVQLQHHEQGDELRGPQRLRPPHNGPQQASAPPDLLGRHDHQGLGLGARLGQFGFGGSSPTSVLSSTAPSRPPSTVSWATREALTVWPTLPPPKSPTSRLGATTRPSESGTTRLSSASRCFPGTPRRFGPWCLSVSQNILGIGYDEGSVVVKIGSEQPLATLNSGKILIAKGTEICVANLRAMAARGGSADEWDFEFEDGERVVLPFKELGCSEIYPQDIQFHPNGRFLSVCGDGEFVIYTTQALRSKCFGKAAGSSSTTTSRSPFPSSPASSWTRSSGASFWESSRASSSASTTGASAVWQQVEEALSAASFPSGEDGALRLDPNEGIETAFDFVSEINDKVESGEWISTSFVYVTSQMRLQVWMNGFIDLLAYLPEKTMYHVLGYVKEIQRIMLMTRDFNCTSYSLDLNYDSPPPTHQDCEVPGDPGVQGEGPDDHGRPGPALRPGPGARQARALCLDPAGDAAQGPERRPGLRRRGRAGLRVRLRSRRGLLRQQEEVEGPGRPGSGEGQVLHGHSLLQGGPGPRLSAPHLLLHRRCGGSEARCEDGGPAQDVEHRLRLPQLAAGQGLLHRGPCAGGPGALCRNVLEVLLPLQAGGDRGEVEEGVRGQGRAAAGESREGPGLIPLFPGRLCQALNSDLIEDYLKNDFNFIRDEIWGGGSIQVGPQDAPPEVREEPAADVWEEPAVEVREHPVAEVQEHPVAE
ncbi:coatomer subunit beta' isoform X2, partial [Cryptosporidium felis]